MRVAVTYEDGKVYQHFGHAKQFKIFEVEKGAVTGSEVVDTEGSGHGAMAGFLDDKEVDVLICGNIGSGAMSILDKAGIDVVAGVEGDADKAVEQLLAGELQSTGANCSHDEGSSCGDGGCGGGCSSCGGGCGGGRRITLEGKNAGKTCRVHYKGTFNDGEQFDSSYDRGEPLEFICGAGQMISGFDKAVVDMEVGESKDIHLMPEEAYGPSDPEAFITVEIAKMPGAEGLEVGQHVYLQNMYGQPFRVLVSDKTEETITFDANHEMAGKELNFHIELVEVE